MNVVAVRRKSDRVMAVVLTLGREVMRVGHKAEDHTQRKFVFMMKWRKSGTWEVLVKSSFLWGDFNGHLGK